MSRSAAVTSRIMASIPNRDTGPELLLRRELHRRGLRYRLKTRLYGNPDVVFPTPRVVVFVDGDYWHGNTWRLRGHASLEAYFSTVTNGDFWKQKITRNVARDRAVTERLTSDGWTVLRLWESQVNAATAASADVVEHAVRAHMHRAEQVPA